MSWPLPGYSVGRGFSGAHQAVDIPAPSGTDVRAYGAGIVVGAGDDQLTPYNLDLSDSGGGKLVTIRSAAQGGRIRVEHQYAHLSSIGVTVGQRVSEGQVIGKVGTTGNSTGPHLHFGLRINGVWVDGSTTSIGGLSAAGVAAPAAAPPGYGSGPVQAPNGDEAAYPLDAGKTCAPGYVVGTVNPQLHGAIPGSPWWNRPTFEDGTILACVRQGLGPGDNAALSDAERIAGGILEGAGDLFRNGIILFALLALLILGAWALTRGGGGAGAAIAV